MLKVLLIQARAQGDDMLAHEQDCIRRKLGNHPVEIESRNAAVEPADAAWLEGKHLFLIGGSGDFSVHHPLSRSWVTPLHKLINRAISEKIPSMAICFGHQLLGVHLGSQVITEPRRAELGTVDMVLTTAGEQDPVFSDLPHRFRAHCGHTDMVDVVPRGVVLLARNETLEAQAFKVRDCPFYSVQFHPDMTGDEARNRYLAYQWGFSEKLSQCSLEYANRFCSGDDEACSLLEKMADLAAGP